MGLACESPGRAPPGSDPDHAGPPSAGRTGSHRPAGPPGHRCGGVCPRHPDEDRTTNRGCALSDHRALGFSALAGALVKTLRRAAPVRSSMRLGRRCPGSRRMSAGADLPARRWRGWRWLLGVSALVRWRRTGQSARSMLLIYSIFVAAWFARKPIASLAARVPLPGWAHALLATLLVGGLTESLAWLGSFLAREPLPALLHPQLAYDLLLSPGSMLPGRWPGWWAVAITPSSSHRSSFCRGSTASSSSSRAAVFLQGATSLPRDCCFGYTSSWCTGRQWGWPFCSGPPGLLAEDRSVTGSASAGPWVEPRFHGDDRRWLGMLLTPLHLPEPRPIWEAPLW